jgi:hypothetical protein
MEVYDVSREFPRVAVLNVSMSDRRIDTVCYKIGCVICCSGLHGAMTRRCRRDIVQGAAILRCPLHAIADNTRPFVRLFQRQTAAIVQLLPVSPTERKPGVLALLIGLVPADVSAGK